MVRIEVRVAAAMVQAAQWALPKGSVIGRYDDIGSTGFILVAVIDANRADEIMDKLIKEVDTDFVIVTPVITSYYHPKDTAKLTQ